MGSSDYFSLSPVSYRRKRISFLFRLIFHIIDCHQYAVILSCLPLSWLSLDPAPHPLHLFLFPLSFAIPFEIVGTGAPFRRHTGLTGAKD